MYNIISKVTLIIILILFRYYIIISTLTKKQEKAENIKLQTGDLILFTYNSIFSFFPIICQGVPYTHIGIVCVYNNTPVICHLTTDSYYNVLRKKNTSYCPNFCTLSEILNKYNGIVYYTKYKYKVNYQPDKVFDLNYIINDNIYKALTHSILKLNKFTNKFISCSDYVLKIQQILKIHNKKNIFNTNVYDIMYLNKFKYHETIMITKN